MRKLLLRWFVWLIGDHDSAGPAKRAMGALFLKCFPGQITCREFDRFVLDYHQGDLSERERRVFEFHMAICPMCRVHFRSYLRTIELGRKLFADDEAPVPEEVPEELVKAIMAARTQA